MAATKAKAKKPAAKRPAQAKAEPPKPPADDGGYKVRTAELRLVLLQGTLEDHEFDVEKAMRELRRVGGAIAGELRPATREERARAGV
jgi:hypothetical protein